MSTLHPVLKTLGLLSDGEVVRDLHAKLKDAAAAVNEIGGTATVTLKLKVQRIGRNQLTTTGAVGITLPSAPSDPTVFFLDPEGEFSRSNPDQMRLSRVVEQLDRDEE